MPPWPAGKLKGPHAVGGNDGPYETPQVYDVDLESLCSTDCEEIDQNVTVIVQNTKTVDA